jgi:hypothetical protein
MAIRNPNLPPTRAFESCTEEEMQDDFGLCRVNQLSALDNWLAAPNIVLNATEQFNLNRLQTRLKKNTNIWNEDELKLNFIGPLLIEIDYDTAHYRSFSQRKLSAIINNIELQGKVDFVISSGKQKPKHPFFCLHEYKRPHGRSSTSDPIGQLLSEMITAQHQNKVSNLNFPIYGLYVEGKFWNFMVLEGNEYAESDSFDAVTDDIFKIYDILHHLKTKINELIIVNGILE